MDVSTATEVAPVNRYRLRLEKSTGGEVVLMEWSPAMDVLAVALADHSVRLDHNIKSVCNDHAVVCVCVCTYVGRWF